MPLTFRFEVIRSRLFGRIYRPVALVEFRHKKEDYWVPIQMIVDTGADYSILPRAYAAPLGIDLRNDCSIHETMGIGGSERVYLYRGQPVRLGSFIRRVPIGFLDRETGPALLGRHDFLQTFKWIFDGRQVHVINPRPRKGGVRR